MNEPVPHPRVFKLLRSFCPDHLYEEISGDLIQRFEKDVKAFGIAKAKRRLVWSALRFFRPAILLRRDMAYDSSTMDRLQNHFRVAYRHLSKHKIFSGINVLGLAVSLAIAFLALQHLRFETRYDHFHANKDQLFRIVQTQDNGIDQKKSAGTFYGVLLFAKEHFPEITHITRFYKWPANTGMLFRANGKIYNERNYFFADSSFFRVFSSLLIAGNAQHCLTDPGSVVISRKLAMKMFGTADVLGRTITYLQRKNEAVVITGVFEDLPANSHFSLDVVRPIEQDWIVKPEYYLKGTWWTYLTTVEGTDPRVLGEKLNKALNVQYKDNPEYKGASQLLQTITDIHFRDGIDDEIQPPGNIALVYVLAGVAIALMLMAWINYINLESARFIARIKEVGIRRIIGSSGMDLVLQFMVQYFCITGLAFLLSVGFVYAAVPYYPYITGHPIYFDLTLDSYWNIPIIAFVIGTFLTGFYPLLTLLRNSATLSLKGQFLDVRQGSWMRRSLLVFQFTASITLAAFAMIVSSQLDFMRSTKSNFDFDRVITVFNSTNYSGYEDSLRKEKNEFFRQRLLQHPGIQRLTASSAIPGEPIGFTYVDLAKRSLNDPDRRVPYKVVYIDDDFIPLFNLRLVAGRNFSMATGDPGCLVVTEGTIRELGFSSADEALGKEIYFTEDAWDKWKIIGIVEDYRHESVKSKTLPTIFRFHKNRGQMVYYSVLLTPGAETGDAINALAAAWHETWPEKPFDYFFLDAFYQQQYKDEVHFARIFSLFTFIALFVASLGILGMTIFEVNARLREFSIRKVLGASVTHLVTLLGRSQAVMILFGGLVSGAAIYAGAMRWLAQYPVKIELTWIYLVLPVAVVIVVVAAASCVQVLKAIKTNPVEYLKTE